MSTDYINIGVAGMLGPEKRELSITPLNWEWGRLESRFVLVQRGPLRYLAYKMIPKAGQKPLGIRHTGIDIFAQFWRTRVIFTIAPLYWQLWVRSDTYYSNVAIGPFRFATYRNRHYWSVNKGVT